MLCWFISRKLKELALASSLWGMSNATIEEFYRIKESTMRQLRQMYHQTGDVVQAPVFSGQPHLMDGLNANVCHFALIFCFMANSFSFLRAAYCTSQTWIFRSPRHTSSKFVGFVPQLWQYGGLWSASDTQWRWYVFYSYRYYYHQLMTQRSHSQQLNKMTTNKLHTRCSSVSTMKPHQLVFVDESHFNQISLRCSYAWALQGDCACCHKFFVWGTK